MKELFRVDPSIYHSPKYSVNDIVISRTGLVEHLHSLGLLIGNKIKQNLDIPEWIVSRKEYAIACVRGLVDTDGCLIIHKYKVNGKWYLYKKLSFTTASSPLRSTVYRIFQEVGLTPRIAQNRDVRIDSQADMKKYFEIIGSHNPKHLNKYVN